MNLRTRFVAAILAAVLISGIPPVWAADISSSDWSETDGSNNSASPNGWKAGMAPNQVEPTARAMMGATKRFYNHINGTQTSGGTANAQTLTYDVAPTAYVTGDVYTFKIGTSNTGATTLNVNSLGATAVQLSGAALAGGELTAGNYVSVVYDGANFQLLSSPSLAAITGGTINNTPIGATTPNTGAFTTLSATTLTASANETAGRTVAGYNNLLRDNLTSVPSDFTSTGNFDNVSSMITATLGTTLVNTTAFSAYIHNLNPNNPSGDTGNSVLYYGIIKSEVNSAHSWGLNPIMNDATGLTGVNMQNEFDVNVVSSSTNAYGLIVAGASTATPADSAAVVASSLSLQSIGLVKYARAFWVQDDTSTLAIEIGAAGTAAASVNGQPIRLHYFNSGSTYENVDLTALSSGALSLSSNVAAGATGLSMFNNGSNTANTTSALSATTISGAGSFSQIEIGSGNSVLEIGESGNSGIDFEPGSGSLQVGFVAGVTCSGSPTSSFASTKGLVTHC